MPPARHAGAGHVLYFVLPDRFENGTTSNDTGGIPGGREVHGHDPTVVNYYHGGDFRGLTDRLDYIKNLGATAIWVTPPLRNKPVQLGSAAYHGYWILDFLQIDPHLGTDEEFREFITQAHARGLRVYMDIIVNHTADVIQFQGGYQYRSKAVAPYRDASGQPFDESAVAFNGLNDPAAFPQLSAANFPYVPIVPPGETQAKHPEWLNDVTLYHNRGNSTFSGENSVHGDFGGLDDTFTEHPRLVEGFIDIYRHWLENYDLDGFRIDTVKHVNAEFWQAFAPAIRKAARAKGRPDFLHFGEVFSGDTGFLSQWPTAATLDTVLDFGLAFRMRDFVSRAQGSSALSTLFDADDLYTDHDSDVHSVVNFIGNHDIGRFGYFLRQDNSFASDAQLLDLTELGHGLMYLVRGQPVVYYGDEQGMIGFGVDTGAREDMFATQAGSYASLARIGTAETGGVAKFREDHPLFQTLRALATLREAHRALRQGAMIARNVTAGNLFAFSRIERNEQVEYLVAASNARNGSAGVALPTSQPQGVVFRRIFDSRTPADPGNESLTTGSDGRVSATLEALQFAVWRAESPLPAPDAAPSIAFTTPATGSLLTIGTQTTDGQTFPSRVLIQASVTGASDFAEVTFALVRSNRPNQFEVLGVDDAPPYRVHWRPPADLPAGESFTLTATVDNLRGGRAITEITGLRFTTTGGISMGIKGSTTPVFTSVPAPATAFEGGKVVFQAAAIGTSPLAYQWLKDGETIDGATGARLTLSSVTAADTGNYAVFVRNLAGTAVSIAASLAVDPRLTPVISEQPVSATVAPGGAVTFGVVADADDPISYQWIKDGAPVEGAVASVLELSSLGPADNGDYAVVVTAGGRSVTSGNARLLVAPPVPGRLINLSVRSGAGSGERTLIAGFVIQGAGGRSVLVRGIGPTLADFGVNGALADPLLALFAGAGGDPLVTNDDWRGDEALVQAFDRTGAFSLPSASADAAALATLAPDPYTVHVSGKGEIPGIALVEIYEDASGDDGRLVNLSTRTIVGSADETLIAGFAINGNVPRRLLVRAIGPALVDFGVVDALADPHLALFREGEPTPLATSDDWGGGPALTTAFLDAGAFPLAPDSLDAAFVITVVPGLYSAHVTGFGVTTGVGLVEVYELP